MILFNGICRTLLAGQLILFSGAVIAQATPEFGDDSSEWANDGECDDPRFEGKDMAAMLLQGDAYRDASDCRSLFELGRIRIAEADGAYTPGTHSGELAKGDETLESGEFYDSYWVDVHHGDEVVVDLSSTDFDPYLIVVTPGGSQFDNDDHQGDSTRSRLEVAVAERGRYEVRVTSFAPGEIGAYDVEVKVDEGAAIVDTREEHGELAYGDEKLESGEFVDYYQFLGKAGQRLRVDLFSNDFDTYVIVVPPEGEQLENDDGETEHHSFVETDIHEAGVYRILVTSFEPGEVGEYVLKLDQTEKARGEPEKRTVAGVITAGLTDNEVH